MAIRELFRIPGMRKQSVVSDAASDSTGHESNSSKSSKTANPLKLVKSLSLMKSRTNSSINSNSSDKNNVSDGADNIKIIDVDGDNNSSNNAGFAGNTLDPDVPILDGDGGNADSTLNRAEKGVPSWLKKKNKKANKKEKKPLHPSEKPLTLVNIQHQEMLNQFTWTFGNRRGSYDSGISPGTSRLPSFDHGSRPLPAGSPLADGAGVNDDDDGQQGDYFMMPYGRREAFQSSLLNPDSAAFARRPAMQMA